MSNPQRVDLTERKFVGIPRRAAIIIGLSIAAGFLLILGLPLNLLGRLVVGVGVALGGLSLAFLKVDGLNPEAWLLESLSFRRRGRGRARGDSAPHPERQIQRGRHAPRRCPQPGRRLLHPSCPASGAGR